MRVNKIKMNKKILALLSGLFILPNQATENHGDIILPGAGNGHNPNRGNSALFEHYKKVALNTNVATEVKNLTKVARVLFKIEDIVKRLESDRYTEKQRATEEEKIILEKFFGGERNCPWPNKHGRIENLWRTERWQLNQLNPFSYTKEFSGGLPGLFNRLYRFEDQSAHDDVLALHLNIVESTNDLILRMERLEPLYAYITKSTIRVNNITFFGEHRKLIEEEYIKPMEKKPSFIPKPIPVTLLDHDHPSGLNFEGIKKQLEDDRRNGESTSFSTDIAGCIRTYVILLDVLDKKEDIPDKETIINELIEAQLGFSRKLSQYNLTQKQVEFIFSQDHLTEHSKLLGIN